MIERIAMTEEQKFIFDLKGYLLIPEVSKAFGNCGTESAN